MDEPFTLGCPTCGVPATISNLSNATVTGARLFLAIVITPALAAALKNAAFCVPVSVTLWPSLTKRPAVDAVSTP